MVKNTPVSIQKFSQTKKLVKVLLVLLLITFIKVLLEEPLWGKIFNFEETTLKPLFTFRTEKK